RRLLVHPADSNHRAGCDGTSPLPRSGSPNTVPLTDGQSLRRIMTTTAPDVGLAAPGALSRLLAPVRTHLLVCAVLSAAGAVCGFLPYLAIAEIARAVLADGTAESVATVRLWVAVGIAGAAGRM